MRAVLLALTATLFLAACGGDDDDTASATPDPATANAINLDKDKDAAFKVLQQQIDYLSDGQNAKAYDTIHPAQRALFTKEQFEACREEIGAVPEVKLKLKEAAAENDKAIVGTTSKANAIALTVELDIDGEKDTDTMYAYKTDGQFYTTLSNPEEVTKGTC